MVNQGHIELKDGGRRHRDPDPLAGFSTAINEGTIIVGDGRPNFQSNYPVAQRRYLPAATRIIDGMGSTTSINAETGIIVTGDDSVGVGNRELRR